MKRSNQSLIVQNIPLDKLKKCDENARKVPHTKEDIEALANSIEAHGQIQNLVVKTERDAEGNATGGYLVIAGEGRRLAQLLRAKRKKINADHPIACVIDDTRSATAVSLAENDVRRPSHPVDQLSAFKMLADAGQSIDEIAAQFSVSPLIVKQRLKLANVAPEFIELYRTGKVELSVLMALALTDDHAKQQEVWKSLRKQERYASLIRERLTQHEIAVDDPMVKFVGLKVYEKAGGLVRRDLFAEHGNEGYVMDAELLRRLADEKLQQEAEKVKAEGFTWVEVISHLDYAGLAEYGHVQPTRRAPTAEEAEALAILEGKRQKLCDEAEAVEEDEERQADLEAQIEAVDSDIDLLNQRREVPTREQVAVAGAIVTIDRSGKLRIERNLLKPEDTARFARAEKAKERAASGGPRIHSAALVRRLTAHRTLALQATLAQRPDVALVALTHRLVLRTFFNAGYSVDTVVQIETETTALDQYAPDVQACKAQAALTARGEMLRSALPDDPLMVFAWLLQQPQEAVLQLCAYCVAKSLNGVSADERSQSLDALAGAAGLDMRAWWAPTAHAYLSSLPKARILDGGAGSGFTGSGGDARATQEGGFDARGGEAADRYGMAAQHLARSGGLTRLGGRGKFPAPAELHPSLPQSNIRRRP
jgi:ParB family chromosome partitioning protein